MIAHHPPSEVLADWARGSLHAGAMLAVGCHVHGCALCRDEAALWESTAGTFLEATAPVPLVDGALARVLSLMDEAGGVRGFDSEEIAPKFLRRFDVPQLLLRQRIGMRRWVTPKIWFAPIATGTNSTARTYIVFAGRNTTLPMHTHVGREFTCVLAGRFSDDSGSYGPGDFAETDDMITHAPAVTGETECLCLISAEAPMRLTGTPARVIQALAGNLY
jgi:putative transcriptional regulator